MRALDKIYYDIVDEIGSVPTSRDVKGMLNRVVQSYGLRTAAYFAVNIPSSAGDDPYLAVTYSDDWVEHYKSENYVRIDPVLREGFSAVLPIDWRKFDLKGSKLRAFFGEAAEFGLGRQGLTFPIRGRHGERALFTITSDVSDQEWDQTLGAFQRDFQVLAYHIHNAILRTEAVEEEEVHLSPREIECLKWVARGKTVSETATILSLSDRTVRFYLDLARAKLNATNVTHAVAKAMNMSIFFGTR
ncbi:LuxR family transcriptional regulator [Labrys sp. KNU-23]|uniref:LuxR family transcriptional regulator n=1 Tax=Labrys sp. KNU-23 TaxID=2789216 RepID=UPI0011EDCEB1|nr:LuxR family transcriptional regulator [Labrys sp. KNU-23]QEN86969.1 LuxR family transcriptional regulator [Labrys sp. KNU-23]